MSGRGRKAWAVVAVLVPILALVDEAALAQFRPPFGNREQRDRRAEQPALPPADVAGKVDAIVPGWIQIVSATGETWRLQVPPNAQVKLFGAAAPDFLASGQFVSFAGEVDKEHGRVVEPISKLTVFTPDQAHMIGAFPAGGELAPAGQAPAAAAPKSAPTAEGQPEAKKSAAVVAEPFQIAGRLASAKNGKLTVVVPNKYFKPSLRAELAEQPEINLELAGAGLYRLARKGDMVEVSGGKLGPQVVQVNEMTITLAEPLGVKEKKPHRRGKEEEKEKEKSE